MLMETEKKYFGSWWVWVIILIVATSILLTGLSYLGIIGKTVVEREVFKRSFQYSEARATAIAIYKAQLAEINHKLTNTNLEANTRNNLEAQAASIRIRLVSERSKQ